MSQPETREPADDVVAAAARRSLIIAVITTLIVGGCLIGSSVLVFGAIDKTIAEQVTVTVGSEGTHLERRGGRHSRRVVRVRHVMVTDQDGNTGRMNSERLRTGDTAEAWREFDGGKFSEKEPSDLTSNRNFFAIGSPLLVALLTIPFTVGSWRRVRGMRGVRLEDAPRLLLVTDRATLETEDGRIHEKLWRVPVRVAESGHPKVAIDSTHDLLVELDKVPVDSAAGVPEQWEGRVLHAGLLKVVVALRTSPQGPWWVMDL